MTSRVRAGGMHLFALLQVTTSDILWGDPKAGSQVELDSFTRFARDAERGLFDALFLAEGLRLHESNSHIVDYDVSDRPDPATRLAALAAATDRLGLIATANATHAEPLDLARRIGTVDVLSKGRAGWNVVTASDPIISANFRRGDYLPYEHRYARAREFVDAVRATWEVTPAIPSGDRAHVSVDIGAPVATVQRGGPVLVQSGDSFEGRDFGASFADAIFTRTRAVDEARAFHEDIQSRLVAHGRTPGSAKILAGSSYVLGDTHADAVDRAEHEARQRLTPRLVLSFIEDIWGIDLSGYDVDGPLPSVDPDPQHRPSVRVATRRAGAERSSTGIAREWRAKAESSGSSMRTLVGEHLSKAERGFIGTPSLVADRMTELFVAGAVDGFVVVPTVIPGGLAEFVDRVVPELQSRGMFREAYEGRTLRDHLGLDDVCVPEAVS